MSSKAKSLLNALPFALLLVWHAWYYMPFLSDDALISLRYSQRLVEGHGLTWTAGPPVEGYSNLLWVLLVAVPHWLGADLIVSARVFGVLFALLVICCLRPRAPGFGFAQNLGSWVAMGFVALSAPMAIWAIGGLEQALLGGLLAMASVLLFRCLHEETYRNSTLGWLSVVLGLICITRPDGPLFSVAAALPLLLSTRRGGLRRGATRVVFLAIGPLLLYGGQLAFRMVYYGDYVPNTARVKIAPTGHRLQEGWDYVVSGFQALGPLSLVALACILLLLCRRSYRLSGLYLGLALVLWNGYLAAIGGDIFPGHRHFVVNVVLLAFALRLGLESLRLEERAVGVRGLVVVLLLGVFVPFCQTQFELEANRNAVEERWEWGGKKVGLWLKSAFEEQQPLVAVTAAGCIPYWTELPCLDMLGLNDHYLPRHPPEDFGTGFIGHELGGGQYVLDRQPDIIVFHTGIGPCFRVGQELGASPLALEMYSPVSIQVDPTGTETGRNALLFFHRYSPKVGMRPEGQQLALPAYLFTELKAAAYFNSEGRIEVQLLAEQPLEYHFNERDGRRWTVTDVIGTDADHVQPTIEYTGDRVSVQLTTESPTPVCFEMVILEARD